MQAARAPFILGLALAAALLALACPVRAEPEPYQLSYAAPAPAPPGCPTESEVVAEVRANVHDAASGEGARIALTITEKGSAFVGELVAFDRSGRQGRRTIQGSTCSDVGKTLAFLAALAIELGGRVEQDPAPAPADVPPPAPQPTAPKPATSPPPRPSTRRQAWKFAVLLGAGLRGALGPSLRPSAEAGVDWGAPSTRWLAPAIRATLVASLSRISHRDGLAKLGLVAGRLEGCPVRIGSPAVALRPCAGLELGAVFAAGELAGGRDVVQRWGNAEASLRLQTWLAPQVFLEIEGAALVPFFRTRYFFIPDRLVYAVPELSGRAALVTGFRFQ